MKTTFVFIGRARVRSSVCTPVLYHVFFSLRSNVLRAYWSMSMVWGLTAEHAVQRGFQYDAVVLARPDVWYHYDVDLPRYRLLMSIILYQVLESITLLIVLRQKSSEKC